MDDALAKRQQVTRIFLDSVPTETHGWWSRKFVDSGSLYNDAHVQLDAETVAAMFFAIDIVYFDSCLSEFVHSLQHGIGFMTVDDDVLAKEAALYIFDTITKMHYFVVCSPKLVYAGEAAKNGVVLVAGVPCETRLDVFRVILEHEVLHLFVDFSLLMCQHEEAHGPTFQYYARHIFGHQSCIHHLHTRRHSRLSDDLPLELMLANCISFTWWLPSMIGPHSSHLDSSYLATEEWCDTDVYRSVCSDNNRRATCERRDSPLGC